MQLTIFIVAIMLFSICCIILVSKCQKLFLTIKIKQKDKNYCYKFLIFGGECKIKALAKNSNDEIIRLDQFEGRIERILTGFSSYQIKMKFLPDKKNDEDDEKFIFYTMQKNKNNFYYDTLLGKNSKTIFTQKNTEHRIVFETKDAVSGKLIISIVQ